MTQTVAGALPGSLRSQNIHIRVAPRQRELIDQAARATGKTRTEFILDTVTRAAENTLVDQRVFLLDDVQWRAFMAALDAPTRPTEALRKLMAAELPWK
jgi:uncharacterized protein (DUF1778 family)